MDLISKHTRSAFADQLVADWTLRTISDLFDGADVPHVSRANGQQPVGSVRRALIAEYCAGIDWSSPSDVRKICSVYEQVLAGVPVDSLTYKKLTNLLRRDGFAYLDGRIVALSGVNLQPIKAVSESIDMSAINDHIRRIEQSVESDPAQAIGSAKELVETVAKYVLARFSLPTEGYESVQSLVKDARKCLPLFGADSSTTGEGARSLRQIDAGMAQIVGGLAQFRNLYGTGHGRVTPSPIEPRHARLVVAAASALCTFMLESVEAVSKVIPDPLS